MQSTTQNQDLNMLVNGIPSKDYQFPSRPDQPQSTYLGSVSSAAPIVNEHPQFALAQAHYTNTPPPKPTPQQVDEYTEDLLFYLVYGPQYEPTTINSLRYIGLKSIFAKNWLCLQPLPGTITTTCDNNQNPPPAQPTLVWGLECKYDDVFQEYLHLDVSNGLQLAAQFPPTPGAPPTPPTTTATTKDAEAPALYLVFYPEHWQFQFQPITLNQYKQLSIEEVLR